MEQQHLSSIRIADLDLSDRPREKALTEGIARLTDTELLAILLGGGLPGLSVVDLSRNILLATDNSLVRLAKMPIRQMMHTFKGVGEAKAVTLAAAFELGRRLQDAMAEEGRRARTQVRSSQDAYQFLRSRVELLDYEEFWVLMLSRANHITEAVCLSQGGTAATVVDVKLLARHVINHLAAGVILVHNHPSGTLSPSVQDDQLTRRIADTLKLLDVKLLDHLIITSAGYYSYNDQGKL